MANPILDNPHYRIRSNTDFWEHKADYVFVVLMIIGIFFLALAGSMQRNLIVASPLITNLFLGSGGTFFAIASLMLLLRGCCSR